jgi:hypothetical protein
LEARTIAVLHDNVEFALVNERVVVLHHIRRVDLKKQAHLHEVERFDQYQSSLVMSERTAQCWPPKKHSSVSLSCETHAASYLIVGSPLLTLVHAI